MTLYRRTSTRLPLAFDVQIQFKDKKLGHGFTRNVNPFGAFIEMHEPDLLADSFVKMRFIDKEKNEESVVQKGVIMHCSEEGVGILFAYDSEKFRKMLDKEMTKRN